MTFLKILRIKINSSIINDREDFDMDNNSVNKFSFGNNNLNNINNLILVKSNKEKNKIYSNTGKNSCNDLSGVNIYNNDERNIISFNNNLNFNVNNPILISQIKHFRIYGDT